MNQMTDTLHLESPAKVNLRLEILKKREDGYHEIRTIFQKISLHDTLHFSLRQRRGVRITTDHPGLPTGKRNLVYQAVRSLLERSDYGGGVDVEIEKRIPLGAGLGGGSSNAATALAALNRLLKINLTKKELMEVGAEIGADVPFFLFGGPAIGSGIGERLRKIELPALWYVLINPNFEVSTRWAYQNFMLTRSTGQPRSELGSKTKPAFEGGVAKCRSGSTLSNSQPSSWGAEGLTKTKYHFNLRELLKTPVGVVSLLRNDLEDVVSSEYSDILTIKRMLTSAGAMGAMMTGSGPTVFGIFPGEEKATEAYHQLKRRVRGRGWRIFQAHSIP
ncbi:MAG: 4-(cytidine 5'-diphospho)-2-C-methyl-D-erythritol kinase [Deltaproteobacteria bacterium]|nr:4-(cytidine 5'-diphospho)-2-C-methyl-D-erythritol kinase [Deltaproteobacteria bacterium]